MAYYPFSHCFFILPIGEISLAVLHNSLIIQSLNYHFRNFLIGKNPAIFMILVIFLKEATENKQKKDPIDSFTCSGNFDCKQQTSVPISWPCHHSLWGQLHSHWQDSTPYWRDGQFLSPWLHHTGFADHR